MAEADARGRSKQRLRTRRDLIDAAARLLRAGREPTLEEVAEAALVSRATAYRHFPSAEALLVEASLDLAFPDADELFAAASTDPVERLLAADAAVVAMMAANEAALRLMLAHSLRLPEPVRRQNRRTPLIEAALAPVRARLTPAAYDDLVKALAVVIGTEAMVVFSDVLATDADGARRVRQWMIRSLVAAALGGSGDTVLSSEPVAGEVPSRPIDRGGLAQR